jgi:putative transposase
MARIARAVAPGIPHHLTQRGNKRQQAFSNDEDYQFYLNLMSEWRVFVFHFRPQPEASKTRA